MRLKLAVAMIFCMLVPATVAEVTDSASNGFTVKITVYIKATPDVVYSRIIHNVGDWWDSAHTFSGNAHNLSIEEKPMGCWCEKLPNQGSVRHMEVVFLSPGKRIVFVGGLGPLQSLAAAGAMTLQLSPTHEGTKLEITYAVTGYLPGGMNTLAVPVDSVLGQQIARLKSYIETGNPAPSALPPGAQR
jgi:hypothetical protein